MVTECEIPPAQLLTEKPDKALARPGVYAIMCDANGRYYVGSSKNMRHRMTQHVRGLRSGLHANPKMRYSYNKYGASRHLFRAIEFTDANSLESTERLWMRSLDSVKSGMNIAPDPNPRKDWKMSDEQRERLSASMRAANLNNGRGAAFNLVAPDGEIFTGTNISAFCREMGMDKVDSNALSSVINGDAISHKGWRAVGGRGRKLRQNKPFCLVPPPGIPVRGSNLRVFCEDNGLDYAQMGRLCRGEQQTCLGWKLAGPAAPITKRISKRFIKRQLISPTGELVEFFNMSQFCRENNLSVSAVNLVITGVRPHHKNWRKA